MIYQTKSIPELGYTLMIYMYSTPLFTHKRTSKGYKGIFTPLKNGLLTGGCYLIHKNVRGLSKAFEKSKNIISVCKIVIADLDIIIAS